MVISELSVVMDDVHVVYNASTGPLGVVFVILLLSSPRRLQCRHAVHDPLGSCARSPPPSYNANTAPLGVAFVTLLLCPRRLQRQHGPSGVVPVVVRSALTFSPLDIELWQDKNVYVLALLMTLMLSDCCGRLRGGR